MDFLNKSFEQAKELFGSMSPTARITSALLLVAIVVSLFYLFQLQSSHSNEYLLGGRPLSSHELAAIEAAFATAGLSDYRIEGNRMLIPRGKKAEYIGAMADGGALPDNFNDYFDKVIQDTSPFMSERQRQSRLKNAKQKELALIIRSMQGVEQATVQYDSVVKRGFPRTEEVTAMVAVRPTGSQELTSETVRSIRHLVSRAIAGLHPEKVSVTDLNGGTTDFGGGEEGSAENNAYAKTKKMYEEFWAKKIRTALSYVKGAVVAVNVELDPQLAHESNSVTFGAKPVPLETLDESKTSTSSGGGPAGRPGLAAQGANLPRRVSSSEPKSQQEETRASQRNITDRDIVATTKASLVPDRVTVSIIVPRKYYREVWKQRNPPQPGADPTEPDTQAITAIENEVNTRIQTTVLKLIPKPPPTNDPYPLVEVASFDTLSTPPEPEPAMSDKAMTWLGNNWSTLGMMLVGLVSLVMLRSMVKSKPTVAQPSRANADASAAAGQNDQKSPSLADELERTVPGETEQQAAERILKRSFGSDGPNLRNELSQLVQEDPDAAVNILRSWIGSVT